MFIGPAAGHASIAVKLRSELVRGREVHSKKVYSCIMGKTQRADTVERGD